MNYGGKTEENIGTEDTSDMEVYVYVDDTLSSYLVQKIGRSYENYIDTIKSLVKKSISFYAYIPHK